MCVTCGCGKPKKDHGDPRNLTKEDFKQAAHVAKLDMHHVVANINQAYDDDKLDKGRAKKEEGKVAPYIVWPKEEAAKSLEYQIAKSTEERRFTLGVAYAPDTPDKSVAADGHRDFMTAQEVEKAAWKFLASHPTVGYNHQEGTTGLGQVVESYVYRGPEWVVSPTLTIQPGTWLVGVVWSEKGWEDVKAGKINGLSMQGNAKRRRPLPGKV